MKLPHSQQNTPHYCAEAIPRIAQKLLIIALPISLLACGNSPQSDIENAIRNNLKDPSSATFKDLRLSTHKTYACISWNAKNGFGGYGSWDVARLKQMSSGWTVTELQLRSDEMHWCDQDTLNFGEEISRMR